MRPSSASLLLLLLALSAPAANGQTALSAEDLALVDCRLPRRERVIGGRIYTVAGRAARTTALDCRIRGGEYTSYDRANYATSLKVWLAAAEKGDHDAEYYVGKIYEGVLGTPPDYKSAAGWYQKAAAARHSASQFALGQLYEKGLGVPEDGAKAFQLYRQAAGRPDNYVIVESGKYEALEQAAEDLALRQQEIDDLQHQLDELRKQQTQDEKRKGELQNQLDEQQRKAAAQKAELAKLRGQVRALAATAAAKPAAATPATRGTLGKFYALVIGNSQYDRLPPVPTAERDAKAMAEVLREQYGFEVTLLLNAKSAKILSALYELSQSLAENDNLVVFYAGHGKRDLRNRRGWWLATDALPDSEARTNWIPNQEVSDRLSLIPARHILVLADASYVGDITRGAPQPEPQNLSAAQWEKYVEATKRRRARLALSSGADEPDAGSRFTAALLDALKKQKGVFPASRIHREVVNALTSDERASAIPTYAPLQSAFHDGVDFLLQHK